MCFEHKEKHMRIKDIPQEERPKEKLMYAGAESLSTSELLALIIRTGNSSKSALQLAEDVLAYSAKELGSLREADVQELTEIDGIGSTKACSIVASLELARFHRRTDVHGGTSARSLSPGHSERGRGNHFGP